MGAECRPLASFPAHDAIAVRHHVRVTLVNGEAHGRSKVLRVRGTVRCLIVDLLRNARRLLFLLDLETVQLVLYPCVDQCLSVNWSPLVLSAHGPAAAAMLHSTIFVPKNCVSCQQILKISSLLGRGTGHAILDDSLDVPPGSLYSTEDCGSRPLTFLLLPLLNLFVDDIRVF